MERISYCRSKLAGWGKNKLCMLEDEIVFLEEKSALFVWSRYVDCWREMKENVKRINELLSKKEGLLVEGWGQEH